MAKVVVEVNWPEPVTEQQIVDKDSHLMRCVGERGGTWISSLVSNDRKRTICVFDAPDAESMRDAYRRGGIHDANIWTAEQYAP
jgi:hypothetical protein